MKRTIDQDNMSNAYWSNISLYKSFLGATLISSLVLLADINQFLILCIEKIGKNSFMVIAATTITVMIVMLIKRHFIDLLKIPCGNVSDSHEDEQDAPHHREEPHGRRQGRLIHCFKGFHTVFGDPGGESAYRQRDGNGSDEVFPVNIVKFVGELHGSLL